MLCYAWVSQNKRNSLVVIWHVLPVLSCYVNCVLLFVTCGCGRFDKSVPRALSLLTPDMIDMEIDSAAARFVVLMPLFAVTMQQPD